MKQRFAAALLLSLLATITLSGCNKNSTPVASHPARAPASWLEDVKTKTGVSLPEESALILYTNDSSASVDRWLFQMDNTNAEFPIQLKLQFSGHHAIVVARTMELDVGVPENTINGDTTAAYYGTWQTRGDSIFADFVIATGGSYLELRRVYHHAWEGLSNSPPLTN